MFVSLFVSLVVLYVIYYLCWYFAIDNYNYKHCEVVKNETSNKCFVSVDGEVEDYIIDCNHSQHFDCEYKCIKRNCEFLKCKEKECQLRTKRETVKHLSIFYSFEIVVFLIVYCVYYSQRCNKLYQEYLSRTSMIDYLEMTNEETV